MRVSAEQARKELDELSEWLGDYSAATGAQEDSIELDVEASDYVALLRDRLDAESLVEDTITSEFLRHVDNRESWHSQLQGIAVAAVDEAIEDAGPHDGDKEIYSWAIRQAEEQMVECVIDHTIRRQDGNTPPMSVMMVQVGINTIDFRRVAEHFVHAEMRRIESEYDLLEIDPDVREAISDCPPFYR